MKSCSVTKLFQTLTLELIFVHVAWTIETNYIILLHLINYDQKYFFVLESIVCTIIQRKNYNSRIPITNGGWQKQALDQVINKQLTAMPMPMPPKGGRIAW